MSPIARELELVFLWAGWVTGRMVKAIVDVFGGIDAERLDGHSLVSAGSAP